MKYSKFTVVALVLMGLGAVKTSFAEDKDNGVVDTHATVRTTAPAVGTIGVNANVTTPDANRTENNPDRRNRNDNDRVEQGRSIRTDNDRVEYRHERYRKDHEGRTYTSVRSDCDDSNAVPVSAQVRTPANTDASIPAAYEQRAPNPNNLTTPNTSSAPTPIGADTQINSNNPSGLHKADTGTDLRKPDASPELHKPGVSPDNSNNTYTPNTTPNQTTPTGNNSNDANSAR